MVKRIIWSSLASKIYSLILQYYIEKNGNKIYSRKLNSQIKKTISLISNYPKLGKMTEIDNIREFVEGNLKIIYRIRDNEIVILMIWDTRQNPENFEIKNIV